MHTPVFSLDGTVTEVDLAPAAPPIPTNQGPLRPSWDFKDPALRQQEIDANFHAAMMRQNPALTRAQDVLEAKRLQTKRWSEVVEDLSRRRMEAEILANRARSSVFAEDYLHSQGLGGPTPIPGRQNRLNVLTAELEEAKAEYAASFEELETAQAAVTAELAKAKL